MDNKSRKNIRQSELYGAFALSGNTCHKVRDFRHCEKIKLLIDRVLELEDNLSVLQQEVVSLRIILKNLCVLDPF